MTEINFFSEDLQNDPFEYYQHLRELAGELGECAGEIGLVEVFYLMHDGTGCAIKGVPAEKRCDIE